MCIDSKETIREIVSYLNPYGILCTKDTIAKCCCIDERCGAAISTFWACSNGVRAPLVAEVEFDYFSFESEIYPILRSRELEERLLASYETCAGTAVPLNFYCMRDFFGPISLKLQELSPFWTEHHNKLGFILNIVRSFRYDGYHPNYIMDLEKALWLTVPATFDEFTRSIVYDKNAPLVSSCCETVMNMIADLLETAVDLQKVFMENPNKSPYNLLWEYCKKFFDDKNSQHSNSTIRAIYNGLYHPLYRDQSQDETFIKISFYPYIMAEDIKQVVLDYCSAEVHNYSYLRDTVEVYHSLEFPALVRIKTILDRISPACQRGNLD